MLQSEKGNNLSQIFTEFYEKLIRSSILCTQTVCLLSGSLPKPFSRYFVHNVALLHNMPKSAKGDTSAKIDRILPKVNRVIYTLGTIYMPNIMILAQGVLQIFCSQGCFST